MFMVEYRFLSHPSPRNMSPSQSSCTVCIVLMSPCLVNTKSCHCHCPRRCHPLTLPQPPTPFFFCRVHRRVLSFDWRGEGGKGAFQIPTVDAHRACALEAERGSNLQTTHHGRARRVIGQAKMLSLHLSQNGKCAAIGHGSNAPFHTFIRPSSHCAHQRKKEPIA